MQRGDVSIEIAALPEVVYEVIADVTRIGELSPECRRADWLDARFQPTVGTRFKGHNSWFGFRWARTCEITTAEPGREFAFETLKGWGFKNDVTKWRYRFERVPDGTRVTESYELVEATLLIRLFEVASGRSRGIVRGMRTTLQRLKVVAEQRQV